MKRLLQLWIAIGVLGAIWLEVSAMEPANDPATFFAVSKIGGKGIASLITMSDEQLAATRGGAICAVCSSIISLSQGDVEMSKPANARRNAPLRTAQTNTSVKVVQQNTADQVNQPASNASNSERTQSNSAIVNQTSPNGTTSVRVVSEQGGKVMVVTQQESSVVVVTRGIPMENFLAAVPVQTLLDVDRHIVQTITELTSPLLGSPATILQGFR